VPRGYPPTYPNLLLGLWQARIGVLRMQKGKRMSDGPNPYILWVDLETTGTEPEDQIIEIGAILTDEHFVEQSRYHAIYKSDVPLSSIDPFVLKMHADNGLLFGTHAQQKFAGEDESEILAWLGKAGALKMGRLTLAGSGVSHFDRRFINRAWPKLSNRLQYWAYDIGNVRRFFRLATGTTLDPVDTRKTHRAMDDIEYHLDEARLYVEWMQSLAKYEKGFETLNAIKESPDGQYVEPNH
jgi:oligoribonuclease